MHSTQSYQGRIRQRKRASVNIGSRRRSAVVALAAADGRRRRRARCPRRRRHPLRSLCERVVHRPPQGAGGVVPSRRHPVARAPEHQEQWGWTPVSGRPVVVVISVTAKEG